MIVHFVLCDTAATVALESATKRSVWHAARLKPLEIRLAHCYMQTSQIVADSRTALVTNYNPIWPPQACVVAICLRILPFSSDIRFNHVSIKSVWCIRQELHHVAAWLI